VLAAGGDEMKTIDHFRRLKALISFRISFTQAHAKNLHTRVQIESGIFNLSNICRI
jgi:hypothetical protein